MDKTGQFHCKRRKVDGPKASNSDLVTEVRDRNELRDTRYLFVTYGTFVTKKFVADGANSGRFITAYYSDIRV